jgi:hypothetical protein
MKSIESAEQQALMQWAELSLGNRPELKLLYHIPNGGKRNKITAARLKKEGVKAGVPDLCLPVPRGMYHGMYIEMKAPKGKTTKNQDEWIKSLEEQGYYVVVCHGWEKAMSELLYYLDQLKEGA